MIYEGSFSSRYDNLYTVQIRTKTKVNGKDEKVKLTLSSEPCIIETNSDSLFSPIKSKNATIQIVTNDIIYDLYSSAAQQNEVLVYKNEKIIFNGYTTPCIYSQDWEYLSVIEVEAVDKLSTLQYFEYQISSPSSGFQTLSFMTLIRECLKKAGYSNYFYFPQKSQYVTSGVCVLDSFGCQESNFFDDDDEATPWTYEELLEEICKFLCVSCVPYGADVYFVDYGCVANEEQKYDKYFVKGNLGTQGVHTCSIINLSKNDYASGTPSLSLDEVYNKISVSASVYEYGKDAGSLSTEVFDKKTTILSNYAGMAPDFITTHPILVTKDLKVPYEAYIKMYTPSNESKWRVRLFESNLIDDIPNDVNKYKPSSSYGQTAGKKVAEYTYDSDKLWCWQTDVTNYEGIKDNITNNPSINWRIPIAAYKNIPILVEYNVIKRNNVPVTSDWKKCIMFTPFNYNWSNRFAEYENQINTNIKFNAVVGEYRENEWWRGNGGLNENNPTEPLQQYKDKIIDWNCKPCFEFEDNAELIYSPDGDKTAYLYIDGKLMWIQDHYYKKDKTEYRSRIWYDTNGKPNNFIFPPNEIGYSTHTLFTRKHDDPNFNKGWKGLKLKVQIGDKYYNGSQWTTTPSTFDIYFHSKMADPDKLDSVEELCLYEWESIVYNTTFKDNIGKEVYAIPIKNSDNLYGRLKVTVYTPYATSIDPVRMWWNTGTTVKPPQGAPIVTSITRHVDRSFFPQRIFLQDFTIDYTYDASEWSDTEEKEDSDIVYFNIINEEFVQEYDDIECKINTYVEGKPMSRSYNINTQTNDFVRSTYNPITNTNTIPENHIIEKIYNHYATPKKIFEMEMIYNDNLEPASVVKYSALTDKNMIIDSEEINLIEDTNKIKLVEY